MNVLNIVAFVAFATSTFTRSTDPIIPQIATAFSVDPGTVALLATAFALPYAAIQPVLGALADMFNKTRLMTGCLLVLVLASVVAAFAPNIELLFAMRVVSGIASGGVFPIALAVVGDNVPLAQRQVALGRLLGAAMIGNLLGASGAGAVADLFGWRGVFVATALVGFVVLVVAVIGLRRLPDRAPGRFDLSTLGPNYRAIFGNPEAKWCFGVVFVEAMLVFGLFPHVANLLAAAGEERASIAGLVIAGFGLGALGYTLVVSRVLLLVSPRRLTIAGGMLMCLCFMALALRLSWPYEFVSFLLLGFGMYFMHGFIQVASTELAPAARGSALALHSMAFYFGQAVGPVVYGHGFTDIGVGATLIAGGIGLAVTGVVTAMTLRRADMAAT